MTRFLLTLTLLAVNVTVFCQPQHFRSPSGVFHTVFQPGDGLDLTVQVGFSLSTCKANNGGLVAYPMT